MRSLHILIISIIGIVVSYYIVSAFVLQQQAINKQSVYVHLQPEWNSYPGNIVYDITNVWNQSENRQLNSKGRLEMAKTMQVFQGHVMAWEKTRAFYVIPDNLGTPLTKLDVWLYEK